MNALTCLICGHEGYDVQARLVRWDKPEEGQELFGFIPRCKDRAACRQRCDELGEEWPVADPGPLYRNVA